MKMKLFGISFVLAFMACAHAEQSVPDQSGSDPSGQVQLVNGGDCDAECQAWQRGNPTPLKPAVKCEVTITAPTYGGEVGLDVRLADGKTRPGWTAPHIKYSGPNRWVVYHVGCDWLKPPTMQVYLCVDDGSPLGHYSRRWRVTGDLDRALVTKRLDMCLLGEEKCAYYKKGMLSQGFRPPMK